MFTLPLSLKNTWEIPLQAMHYCCVYVGWMITYTDTAHTISYSKYHDTSSDLSVPIIVTASKGIYRLFFFFVVVVYKLR